MLFPFERIVLSTPVFFAVGDRFAIVLLTFPGSCQFLAGPIGDSYSGGDAFFDAPPNPTGWVRICDSPNGRCDLPFQTLVETLSEEVSIDIKPGSDPNSINCRHNGVIPVAILTTSDFDATTVDPSTVALGLGGATLIHRRAHIQDVDGDGDLDMVLHFRQQDTEIVCGDEEACLTGETTDGTPIEGCDAIRTVGGPRR